MKSPTITADELRAEVERLNLNRSYPKGFTTREFAEAMGLSYGVGQAKLSSLISRGHARFLGNRPMTRMDGRAGVNPVYGLVKK